MKSIDLLSLSRAQLRGHGRQFDSVLNFESANAIKIQIRIRRFSVFEVVFYRLIEMLAIADCCELKVSNL